MGCASSQPATTISASALFEQPALPQSKDEAVEVFNQLEESDEQALHSSAHRHTLEVEQKFEEKFKRKMSISCNELVKPPPTIEERVEEYRLIAQDLPAPTAAQSDSVLDADEITPDLADQLYKLLLSQNCPSPPVSKRLLYKVLLASIDRMDAAGPVVDVPLPEGPSRQIVVGDTHGQLEDVLTIFLNHGPPSATNRYVFNGDVADRGPNAVEIFLLILMYALAMPGAVWVTRGNHEARDINERPAGQGGGFCDEVRAKYDSDAFELFQLLFNHMPLAASIGGSIFVVHAGLPRSPSVTVDDMRAVQHKMDVPAFPNGDDEVTLFDCLWSDPQVEDGIQEGKRGQGTINWGPDVTRAFLARNGMDLLVRSHQVPKTGRGYSMHHGNKVLTVFSASNYGGVCRNMGAVLIIPSNGRISCEEHTAKPLDELREWHKEQVAAEEAAAAKQPSLSRGGSLRSRSSKGLAAGSSKQLVTKSNRSSRSLWNLVRPPAGDGDAREHLSQLIERSRQKLLDNVLDNIKSKICKTKLKLRVALERRQATLASDGQASEGGTLLPVAQWHEVLEQTLELEIKWGALPETVQKSLASVVLEAPPEKSGAAPELDPKLFPAVDIVAFLGRFGVELRDPSAASTPERPPPSQELLLICYEHIEALEKALKSGAEATKPEGSHVVPPHVSRVVFLAAAEALVAAIVDERVEEGLPEGALFAKDDFEALADAAPKTPDGRILYDGFASCLRVVDFEPSMKAEDSVRPVQDV